MSVKIIKTEGYGLLAEVEVNGRHLNVMDNFSVLSGERQRPEVLAGQVIQDSQVEFDFLEDDAPWTWEEMFSGNPKHKKRLVLRHIDEWAYDAYGELLSINPVVVDFGAIQLDIGDFTHDPQCVGEWVLVKVARIDMWVQCLRV